MIDSQRRWTPVPAAWSSWFRAERGLASSGSARRKPSARPPSRCGSANRLGAPTARSLPRHDPLPARKPKRSFPSAADTTWGRPRPMASAARAITEGRTCSRPAGRHSSPRFQARCRPRATTQPPVTMSLSRTPGGDLTCTCTWLQHRRSIKAISLRPVKRSAPSARPDGPAAATCTSSCGQRPAGTAEATPSTRCPNYENGSPCRTHIAEHARRSGGSRRSMTAATTGGPEGESRGSDGLAFLSSSIHR